MSNDFVASLADRFGAPAALIERSAEARATAAGSTPEEVLAAWAGGVPAPASTPPPPAPDETPEPEVDAPEPVEVAAAEPTEPVVEEAAQLPEIEHAEPPPALVPARVPEPPPSGSLSALLLGALALFAVMFMAVVIAPTAGSNAQTLDAVPSIVLSDAALDGRDVYLAEGCALCHTQQVRPIVTDADLGIVTLSGSPLIPGIQRRGPDLAHVGARQPTDSAAWLTGYLESPDAFRAGSDHASFDYLSSDDLRALVAYLLESK